MTSAGTAIASPPSALFHQLDRLERDRILCRTIATFLMALELSANFS
ncbi:MAG TPA: hypothetical protein V6D43_19720 [Candidatus Sericytochromatia bacterium]